MKLMPLEVPKSLPQDGNSNSQSRINRPVTSNNTNLNKTQKGAEAMHYLEFVLIIVAANSQTNFILLYLVFSHESTMNYSVSSLVVRGCVCVCGCECFCLFGACAFFVRAMKIHNYG